MRFCLRDNLEGRRNRQCAGFSLREESVAVAHVGDVAIDEDEHLGADLFADAVPDARLLIDPNSHDSTLER